jgi:putative endonuclease
VITLYVIRSQINSELYVGITKNLTDRLKAHEMGKNKYTKGLRPWELMYKECYASYAEARIKEKYYKSGSGKEKLKEILAL